MAEATSTVEWAKLQATTCLDIRKEISSVERFCGATGELNHFLRSGARIMERIENRVRTGRLDEIDAESLRGAWNRRVHRHILNQLQADESTPWDELRRRLQKEYGGGRWTPEEDALRMLRMTRRAGQSKGEFAAQLLETYQGVVDKYRETMLGPEAAARLVVIESLVRTQLGEAAGKPVEGEFAAAAHALIDAAGRGEEEEGHEWKRVARGWRPAHHPRQEGRLRRREEGRERRRDERKLPDRSKGNQRSNRHPEGRRCFSCGKSGHLQARCAEVSCYQCGNKGHLARSCPYRAPPRRSYGEPMEVNVHRPSRKSRSRAEAVSEEASSGEEESDGSSTTSSKASITTYAAVVRKKRELVPQAAKTGTSQ